jgi:hypothetical protein
VGCLESPSPGEVPHFYFVEFLIEYCAGRGKLKSLTEAVSSETPSISVFASWLASHVSFFLSGCVSLFSAQLRLHHQLRVLLAGPGQVGHNKRVADWDCAISASVSLVARCKSVQMSA